MIKNITTIVTTTLMVAGFSAQAADFNANIFFPDKHPLAKHGYIEWAEDLKERTGGNLNPTVYTGTVLLEPRAGMSGVRDGIAQVGYHAGTYTPAELPISNAIQELAFNYADPLVASLAATDFNLNNTDAQAQWQKAGIVYGGGYSTPPYNLMCSVPIRAIEDLKGKRLRTPGAAMSAWAESIGAVPVNVPSSEMYQGLEKGTIDCAVNVASDLKSRSLWDVAKYTTMAPLGLYWAGPMWGYNKDFWNGLSDNDRSVMLEAQALAMAKLYIGYQASIDEALTEAKNHGVEIIQPDEAFLSSIGGFADANVARAGTLAKDKYGIENPKAISDAFDASIKKWKNLLASVKRDDAEAIAAIIQENMFDNIDVSSYGK